MKWIIWVLLPVMSWILTESCKDHEDNFQNFLKKGTRIIVPDKFNGIISLSKHNSTTPSTCVIFLKKGGLGQRLGDHWPEINDNASLLNISKSNFFSNLQLLIYTGKNCNLTQQSSAGQCIVTKVNTSTVCDHDNVCKKSDPNMYIINLRTLMEKNAIANIVNSILQSEEGEELNPVQTVELMTKISKIASLIRANTTQLNFGGGIKGVIVKENDPEDVHDVFFGYESLNDNINLIDSKENLASFSRSITVPKEAFKKSTGLNNTVPFAAFLTFKNLTKSFFKDGMASNVLGGEVLAIEMGASITNLSDQISINFRNTDHEGIPSCRSWNGKGSKPDWTDEGCLTLRSGGNITCQCSHLTFFAILMAPPNETTSSSDMKNLTIITQVGCGLSMMFLSVTFFMHFLMRKTKACDSSRILIQLMLAKFLLDFTFLINNCVANLQNSVGCVIMAAFMHYFMLSTLTWFAVQALHLWLQLHMVGKTAIRHYILKVSISGWVLPIIVVIVLLIIGKYGEQIIYTDDPEENVNMCWILDNNVHLIVNMGYYALIFLITFSTFIFILSQLFCQKRLKTPNAQTNRGGKNILIVMGMCSMLGISWGFIFFSHGVFRIPAYYIFTVLNSFQGFFLFIYYYNIKHLEVSNGVESISQSTNSSSTTPNIYQSNLDNPYSNLPGRK